MVIGMDTLLLENMTWKEIDVAKKNGFDSVIIFAASVEQHGPRSSRDHRYGAGLCRGS